MSGFDPGRTSGLLLLNLGTPDAPETPQVRRYLREFLSDARVIDIPAWKRQLVLNLFILPTRPRESASAYREIWTERGSPLLFHTSDLAAAVQDKLGDRVQVEFAMRYGTPSVEAAFDAFDRAGVDRIVCFPLYPQYSSSAFGSAVEDVYRAAGKRWNTPYLHIVPPFYDHPAYIGAIAALARPVLEELQPERVIMSYHGVPERHVTKSDPSGSHCLAQESCCETVCPANRNCYRMHCVQTTRKLTAALGLAEETVRLSFQSRLGKDPWLRPYTDEVIEELGAEGIKRACILSPAFTADCLETIEELGMRGAEDFKKAGGGRLALVPSLNATAPWVEAVCTIAGEASPWARRAV